MLRSMLPNPQSSLLPAVHRPGQIWLALAALLGAPAGAVGVASDAPVPQIVVTATRHAMLDIDVPAAMSVVTRSDIASRGADNVLEAIRGEAGVSLQGRSIGGRKVLSLRGMDSKHTLFLVDGRRVSASDGVIGHSDLQYDWIAVDDIERIEIVRGPLSVLYGSEAMGGVVNVITRQPSDRWRFGATVEGSRADDGRGGDGHRATLQVDGPLAAGLGMRAGAGQTRRSALASPADARISEFEGRDKQDGWIGLVWQPVAGQRLDAEHRVTHEDRWADARERSGARRYHQTVNLTERSMSSLGWESDWAGAAGLSTQLRAYRAMLDIENQRSAGVTINPPQRIDSRVLEGQARARLGAQDLSVGFEAHNEALHDPALPDGRSIAQHRALYLQHEQPLTGALRLTLGLRHDRHNLFGRQTSPRAYLVWHLDGPWTIKGGYSHGFKAPNLKQIVPGARREGPNTFLGNPALRPETSDGLELGLGWQQGPRTFQVMAFDQRVDDLIEVRLVSPAKVPGTGTYTYENMLRARLRGLESSATGPLGAGFSFGLSYTYLDARSGDHQRLDRRPRHSLTLRLDWQGGPWKAGLHGEHSAGQRLPSLTIAAPSEPVPELTLIGAHLVRTLPAGLALSLGVNNLSNLRLSDKSMLFTHVEPPRTWRAALRGRW